MRQRQQPTTERTDYNGADFTHTTYAKDRPQVKIVDITATAVSDRVEGPYVRFGFGAVRKHDFVLVKVTTDEGLVGYGESHHALAPTAVAELVSTSLRDLVLGQDPMVTEDLSARIWRAQLQSHGLGTGVVIAYSGIDMALWDIRGKALGLPVCRLLGATPKQFPAYVGGLALGFREPSELVEEVQSHLENGGFRGVKLRAGDNVNAELGSDPSRAGGGRTVNGFNGRCEYRVRPREHVGASS